MRWDKQYECNPNPWNFESHFYESLHQCLLIAGGGDEVNARRQRADRNNSFILVLHPRSENRRDGVPDRVYMLICIGVKVETTILLEQGFDQQLWQEEKPWLVGGGCINANPPYVPAQTHYFHQWIIHRWCYAADPNFPQKYRPLIGSIHFVNAVMCCDPECVFIIGIPSGWSVGTDGRGKHIIYKQPVVSSDLIFIDTEIIRHI